MAKSKEIVRFATQLSSGYRVQVQKSALGGATQDFIVCADSIQDVIDRVNKYSAGRILSIAESLPVWESLPKDKPIKERTITIR
jgi:hypothetical protein